MRQLIPFVKDIEFDTKIYEISSISLEHKLSIENNDSVVGNFYLSGSYRINDISINSESFEEVIPLDITLDDKYDVNAITIDIDNFYYEIINDRILRVHIDVLIDNLTRLNTKPVIEEIKKDDKEELIIKEKEECEDKKEDEDLKRGDDMTEEEKEDKIDIKQEISSNFLTEEETFITYKVHIIRDNETVEDIITKYNTSKEELLKYNDLSNIVIGNKIIIPYNNE